MPESLDFSYMAHRVLIKEGCFLSYTACKKYLNPRWMKKAAALALCAAFSCKCYAWLGAFRSVSWSSQQLFLVSWCSVTVCKTTAANFVDANGLEYQGKLTYLSVLGTEGFCSKHLTMPLLLYKPFYVAKHLITELFSQRSHQVFLCNRDYVQQTQLLVLNTAAFVTFSSGIYFYIRI